MKFIIIFLSVICLNIPIRAGWTEDMISDYLERNKHYEQSYSAEVAVFLGEVLAAGYTMPDGRNNYYSIFHDRSVADWFYVLRFNGNLSARTVVKSGATIKWQIDENLYRQNNLPSHSIGGGDGWILMSSEDGWAGVTEFGLYSNSFIDNLPRFIMPNVSYPQFQSCSFSGIIPDMIMQANRYRFENNQFTGISNGLRSILGDHPYQADLYNNSIDAYSLDSVLLGFYEYYVNHTPTRDVTVQIYGGSNEGLLHEYYNYHWFRLKKIFSGYTFTLYRNNYTGPYNLSDFTYSSTRYQILLDDRDQNSTFNNVVFENFVDLESFAQVIYISGANKVTFENCRFENIRNHTNGDLHAINAAKNIDSLIIRNCTFNNISADGVQIGQAVYDDTINQNVNYVMIEDCKFINPPNTSVENGVDWKGGCTDKGIVQNCDFTGFKFCEENQGCTGANGEAIVVHYRMSRNLIIRNNRISDGYTGIVVAKGAAAVEWWEYAPRNILVSNNTVGCESICIQAWDVEDVTIQNNIVYNGQYGLWLSNLNNMKVNNNTIVNCSEAPLVEYITSVGSTQYTNNLIAGEHNGILMDIEGSHNMEIEDINVIHFVNAAQHNYHIMDRSDTVISKGINNGLSYDIDNEDRPHGDYPDVGADEYYHINTVEENDDSGVILYPNPNGGTFRIDFNMGSDTIGTVVIYNLNGETIYSEDNFVSGDDIYIGSQGYYISYIKVGNDLFKKPVILIDD